MIYTPSMKETEIDIEVNNHYATIAKNQGFSWNSTMLERQIREREIETLFRFLQSVSVFEEKKNLKVCEIGCGNGYVAGRLHCEGLNLDYKGVDKNAEMITVAKSRELPRIKFDVSDVADFPYREYFDVLVSVRCLINIKNADMQISALQKILESSRFKYLILLEGFQDSQEQYNKLRSGLGFPEIPPSWHNLYLNFEAVNLKFKEFGYQFVNHQETEIRFKVSQDHLSSIYLAKRVLLPAILGDQIYQENRNHPIGEAIANLLPNTRGFSPLRALIWEKLKE
jgi:ubiquinone/menaquinone biosynthesis C-methylase UbiE